MRRNIRFQRQKVKIKTFLCCSLTFFPVFVQSVHAQNVESELERLGRLVRTAGNEVEKRPHLVRIAKLYQLSGNIEGAANAWQSAALAGKRDDGCLMEAAFCFAAIGAFDKANANARIVLLAGGDHFAAKARFLMAEIEAFNRGDVAPIVALLADPVFEAYKSVVYYTVWKLTGDNAYKTLLLSEYPTSLEALVCQGTKAVSAFPSPLWILPANKGDTFNRQEKPAESLALQTGLFSEKANAEALAEKIKQAGFSAKSMPKTRNNKHYWAVIVSVDDNINAAISRLKALGFEAFPVK